MIALAYVGIAAILPFSVLAFGSSIAVHRSATDEAEREALDSGELTAHIALGPLLTPALLHDDPAARREFDLAARQYLDRGGAVHMKVWDANGEIVYSDEPQLEGQRFVLAPADRALLGTEKGTVGVSNLTLKENRLERAQHTKLLEVYFGAHSTNGEPVLVESYYPYDLVTQRASELRDGFLPVMLLALAVLTLDPGPDRDPARPPGRPVPPGPRALARARHRGLGHRAAAHRRRGPRRCSAGSPGSRVHG